MASEVESRLRKRKARFSHKPRVNRGEIEFPGMNATPREIRAHFARLEEREREANRAEFERLRRRSAELKTSLSASGSLGNGVVPIINVRVSHDNDGPKPGPFRSSSSSAPGTPGHPRKMGGHRGGRGEILGSVRAVVDGTPCFIHFGKPNVEEILKCIGALNKGSRGLMFSEGTRPGEFRVLLDRQLVALATRTRDEWMVTWNNPSGSSGSLLGPSRVVGVTGTVTHDSLLSPLMSPVMSPMGSPRLSRGSSGNTSPGSGSQDASGEPLSARCDNVSPAPPSNSSSPRVPRNNAHMPVSESPVTLPLRLTAPKKPLPRTPTELQLLERVRVRVESMAEPQDNDRILGRLRGESMAEPQSDDDQEEEDLSG